MRLPRVRFTVRRMMVAVAVMAALLAGVAWCRGMIRAARDHRERALLNRSQEQLQRQIVASVDLFVEPGEAPGAARGAAALAAHYESLGLKYERAALYPWLPVEPDPPPPK